MLLWSMPAFASHSALSEGEQPQSPVNSSPGVLFCQYIPSNAEPFIGMPVKLGGRPEQTGSIDNSWLFYSIYSGAARKAGLVYKTFLPMRYLLENTHEIETNKVQNGDLIVLQNGLAAMVFQVDPTGRMHFIYASKKRGQVTAFHSENIVYKAYWLEHFKGFFRINDDMLIPARAQ